MSFQEIRKHLKHKRPYAGESSFEYPISQSEMDEILASEEERLQLDTDLLKIEEASSTSLISTSSEPRTAVNQKHRQPKSDILCKCKGKRYSYLFLPTELIYISIQLSKSI